MQAFITISSIVVFLENRVGQPVDYEELERLTGYSLAHIRDLFAKNTGVPLSRYMLSRRVAHAAFDIIHGDDSLIQVASRYGFDNPDTFTRAFRRVTGLAPRDFRAQRPAVGRVKLSAGVFGVGIENLERHGGSMDTMEKGRYTEEGSTVLYGVPKVGYGPDGVTPLPMCLRACASYLGEDLDYSDIMVGSGAAFRLTWNKTRWDDGAVDVIFTYDEPGRIYRTGWEAIGREYSILSRTAETTKDEFIAFIKAQLDEGRPCVALGIVGPPEACIPAGYREGGQTLLGWNFFQDIPEFRGNASVDESGYFVTSEWWENPETLAVMSIGEPTGKRLSQTDILDNAIEVLSGHAHDGWAKGLLAYDYWKQALLDEGQFPEGAVMPILVGRMMSHGDAMDCLGDGRGNAAWYFTKLAKREPQEALYLEIADVFRAVQHGVGEMAGLLGGWERDETAMRNLAKREVREQIATLIDTCKAADEKALKAMKALRKKM